MGPGMNLIISTLFNVTLSDVWNEIPDPIFQDEVAVSPLLGKLIRIANQNTINMLANEINGKHLKVATYSNKPMSSAKPYGENGKLKGSGVAFFILDILRDKFNFTYEIVLTKKNFIMGGSDPEDSLIGLVKSGKVDMAAAFVANILEFRQHVSFSIPIEEETWIMVMRRPKESAVGEGLLAPFNNFVWYLILTTVASFGPCITLVTHIRAKLMPDDEPSLPLNRTIWFVYGVFVKQGTLLAPKANTTRVLFTTWWLFVMLISTFYTANLTAFLTLSEFTLEINGPEDLLKKDCRWVAAEGGAVQYAVTTPTGNMNYLNKIVRKRRAEFKSYSSIDDFFKQVDRGFVLVKSHTTAVYGLYQNYLRKTKLGVPESKRCSYVVTPTPFAKYLRGFIYPMNSTLKTLFDEVLGHIIQSGVVNKLKTLRLPNARICPMDLQLKERQLQNTDLAMTYKISVGGVCVAIVAFIGEIIVKRCTREQCKQKCKNKKIKISKNDTVYHFQDDSRPPPYDSIFGKSHKIKLRRNTQKKVINGREYLVAETQGRTRLIPVRSTSALLYKLEKSN